MKRSNNFNPDWASSPGDTIIDLLEEKNISINDFAEEIDQSLEDTQALLEGRHILTIGLARKLESYLGSSVQFWMSRDYQYRRNISRIRFERKQREWLKDLPVSDMINFGWIDPVPHPSEEVVEFFKFFGVESIDDWQTALSNTMADVSFKISTSYDSKPASLMAWLRQGQLEANRIHCHKWDKAGFSKSLSKIRKLTRIKDPQKFLPKLQDLCSQHGVAVVIVRTPSGCPASGASRFLTADKALIMLSFRYLSDDHFWFSFFHEAAHLLLHGDAYIHIDDKFMPKTDREREANEFASDILVPKEYQEELVSLPHNSEAIIRFSVKIGISPGIVVGQLQKKKVIDYSQMNFLKRRYKW